MTTTTTSSSGILPTTEDMYHYGKTLREKIIGDPERYNYSSMCIPTTPWNQDKPKINFYGKGMLKQCNKRIYVYIHFYYVCITSNILSRFVFSPFFCMMLLIKK